MNRLNCCCGFMAQILLLLIGFSSPTLACSQAHDRVVLHIQGANRAPLELEAGTAIRIQLANSESAESEFSRDYCPGAVVRVLDNQNGILLQNNPTGGKCSLSLTLPAGNFQLSTVGCSTCLIDRVGLEASGE